MQKVEQICSIKDNLPLKIISENANYNNTNYNTQFLIICVIINMIIIL